MPGAILLVKWTSVQNSGARQTHNSSHKAMGNGTTCPKFNRAKLKTSCKIESAPHRKPK